MKKIKQCFTCKVESEIFSSRYSEPICLICEDKFDKRHKQIEEYRKEYKKLHALCPKCGADSCITTLAGFLMESLETYKDKNECKCTQCGDKHIVHDRVPEK